MSVSNLSRSGVHAIHCRLSGPGGIVKAVLLEDEHRLAVVDSGWSDVDAEIIVNFIDKIGRDPHELEFCVLTHRHRDHIGGLRKLMSLAPCALFTHEAEADAVSQLTGIDVDRRLKDGENLDVCGGMRTIHTPGHTPGSIGLHVPLHRTLITGDAIFSAGQWLVVPPPYLCENPQQARESVRKLVQMNLPVDRVLVGHGEDLQDRGSERLNLILVDRRHAE